MKSLKKTLVLLVVFSMILSTLVPAFAATDVIGLDCEDQVTRMEALGIIEGFEDGTFRPDETITRAQMAVVICKMVGINEAAANANANVSSKFSDVAAGEWYTGWVNLASNNGIISGYPDGTFRPNQTLTLNEVLTLCVKALGRGGYVDKMGTWPANYVTEAARLNLLKDVKGASDANRGTVAVIGWNTLRTKTWYVDTETLDGEINLSATNQKTLLEINFEEYTHSRSSEVGSLKEVETVVVDTPSRTTEIGERQIVLDGSDIPNFDFKEKSDYKKSAQPEKTYEKANGDIVAYVPEDVYEDINSLRNKNVTVIFGDENEVALIVVEDTTVEKDFLTKYNKEDDEITVGGEKYELADRVEVIVNDNEGTPVEAKYVNSADTDVVEGKTYYTRSASEPYVYTKVEEPKKDDIATYYEYEPAYVDTWTLEEALKIILGVSTVPTKAFDKAIQVELFLNEDEEVEKIDMLVSGDYDAANQFATTETIVTKVRDEKIVTLAGDIKWNEDKYDEKDYPIVYIDGVRSEITDIEAGDVLTVVGLAEEAKNIGIIYASRKTIEGEVSRVKNKVEIYVDGEVYLPSAMTKALNLDGDIDKAESYKSEIEFSAIHGETAVLYLNVLGEYVLVDADTVDSNWQFALVDHIYDVVEDEEIDDLYSQKLRVVMMDGEKVRSYKLVYDKDDYYKNDTAITVKVDETTTKTKVEIDGVISDPDSAKNGIALTDKVAEGEVIAFKANADGEIELDDVFAIALKTDKSDLEAIAKDVDDDYDFIFLADGYGDGTDESINYDTKRIDVKNTTTTRYKVTSETAILNVDSRETDSWKDLVDDVTPAVTTAKSVLVVKDDATEIEAILVFEPTSGSSDAQYALVLDATYTIDNTTTGVLLLGVDGEEYAYEYDNFDLVEGSLISYTVSDNELTLVDLFVDGKDDAISTIDLALAAELAENKLLETGEMKGAYRVTAVETDYLTYTDDDTITVLDDRFVDVNTEDVVVVAYKLGDDEIGTLTVANYEAASLEEEYVLYFDTNGDTTDGVELLVIIK